MRGRIRPQGGLWLLICVSAMLLASCTTPVQTNETTIPTATNSQISAENHTPAPQEDALLKLPPYIQPNDKDPILIEEMAFGGLQLGITQEEAERLIGVPEQYADTPALKGVAGYMTRYTQLGITLTYMQMTPQAPMRLVGITVTRAVENGPRGLRIGDHAEMALQSFAIDTVIEEPTGSQNARRYRLYHRQSAEDSGLLQRAFLEVNAGDNSLFRAVYAAAANTGGDSLLENTGIAALLPYGTLAVVFSGDKVVAMECMLADTVYGDLV